MAKIGDTRMEISLSVQDRRILRNLTRAIDRLARGEDTDLAGVRLVESVDTGDLDDETLRNVQRRIV